MRILFTGSGDYASPDEKQALGFAQELLRRGHDVMTSFLGEQATAQREGAHEIPGLQAHCHSFRAGGRLSKADLEAAKAFRPDLVHVLGCRVAAVAAGRAYSLATSAPLFVHFADDEWGLMEAHGLQRRLRRLGSPLRPTIWPHTTPRTLRFVAREARALDAIAPDLVSLVKDELGRPCELILPVLPELPATAQDAEAVKLPPGAQVVFYAGAIAPAHLGDFGILLAALRLLRDEGRNVVLAHAGRVLVDADKLLADAALDRDSVIFLGHVPQGSLTALLQAADVLVQPGAPTEFNRLRLPSKLQAYLPSGTPTVTFAIGFGELLDEGTEVLKTHTAAPDELARAIARILDDDQLAARLSDGGPIADRRLFDTARNTDVLEVHYRAHLSG